MFYPDEVIEEVRQSNDIVAVISEYVRLSQRGNSYSGLCPFHKEKTPSFHVNRDKQIYHCFGCNAGGNVISFIMQIENFSFVEAVKYLAGKAGITLPEAEMSKEAMDKIKQKEVLAKINVEAARYFYKCLKSEHGKVAKGYLDKRMLNEDIRKRFGIGYAVNSRDSLYKYLKNKGFDEKLVEITGLIIKNQNGYHDRFWNRVMFPIFDVHDKIIGFGGRIIDKGEPKYLNSPESDIFNKRFNLYGLNYARKSRKQEFLIVEGYMDVIALHQAGFTNAVASLGTALTREQALLIRRYVTDAILIYDSDNAGTMAILRAIPILKAAGITVKILQVTDAKDPDEYINNFGVEAFGSLVQNSMDYTDFQMKIVKKQFNTDKHEERLKAVRKMIEYANEIDNELEKQMYMQKISEEFGVDNKIVSEQAIKNKVSLKTSKKQIQKVEKIGEQTVSEIYKKRERILLSFMISGKEFFDQAIDLIGDEVFLVDLHKSILKRIKNMYIISKKVEEAQLINYFPDLEEQKKVNNIISEIELFSEKEHDKILKEQLKVISNKIIDSKIEGITNKIKDCDSLEKDNLERELAGWLSKKLQVKKQIK